MSTRVEIINDFYSRMDEDARLLRTRQGQLEYFTTMNYIRRFADRNSKILDLGAGTGRYSITLAREGMDVTAIELAEGNLAVLREKSVGITNIRSYRGDAVDLGRFSDDTFDLTLSFGPMYHLYDRESVDSAIDEAIRVTKTGGVLMFAFLSVYGIMYSNYFRANWAAGQEMNFTEDYRVRHFKEQVFTGYDVTEFEGLFDDRPVERITTAGTDGPLELIEGRQDFAVSDGDFAAFADWYIKFAEKRELLGLTNHLLYICRKVKR